MRFCVQKPNRSATKHEDDLIVQCEKQFWLPNRAVKFFLFSCNPVTLQNNASSPVTVLTHGQKICGSPKPHRQAIMWPPNQPTATVATLCQKNMHTPGHSVCDIPLKCK